MKSVLFAVVFLIALLTPAIAQEIPDSYGTIPGYGDDTENRAATAVAAAEKKTKVLSNDGWVYKSASSGIATREGITWQKKRPDVTEIFNPDGKRMRLTLEVKSLRRRYSCIIPRDLQQAQFGLFFIEVDYAAPVVVCFVRPAPEVKPQTYEELAAEVAATLRTEQLLSGALAGFFVSGSSVRLLDGRQVGENTLTVQSIKSTNGEVPAPSGPSQGSWGRNVIFPIASNGEIVTVHLELSSGGSKSKVDLPCRLPRQAGENVVVVELTGGRLACSPPFVAQ